MTHITMKQPFGILVLACSVFIGAQLADVIQAQQADNAPSTTDAATQPASKPATRAPVQQWRLNQTVEVKSFMRWRQAAVLNFRNEWYLIRYTEFPQNKEWVEPWRIRDVGSTVDEIGIPQTNERKAEQGPPPQKPGPAIGKDEHARARMDTPTRNTTKDMKTAIREVNLRKRGAKEDDYEVEFTAELQSDPAYKEIKLPPASPSRDRMGGMKDAKSPRAVATLDPAEMNLPEPQAVELPKSLVLTDPMELMIASQARRAFLRHRDMTAKESVSRLHVLDLMAGKEIGDLALPRGGNLLAVSPSGTRVAIQPSVKKFPNHPLIEIWSLSEANGALSFKCDMIAMPFATLAKVFQSAVKSAEFVDDSHLMMISTDRELVNLDLESGTSDYTLEMDLGNQSLLLSGGGKYLLKKDAFETTVFSTRRAMVVAKFPEARGEQLSLSPDGKYLVSAASGWVDVVDLSTGETIHKFKLIRQAADPIVTFSDRYFMTGDCVVYDTEAGLPVWRYAREIESLPVIPTADGWVYTIADGPGRKVILTPAKLPTPEIEQWRNGKNMNDYIAFGPGKTIALDVNAGGDTASVKEGLKKNLEKRGLKVMDGNTDLVLHVSSHGVPAKEVKFEIIKFGSGPNETKTLSVPGNQIDLSIDEGDKTIYSTQWVFQPMSVHYDPAKDTLESAVAKASVADFKRVATLEFPKMIPSPKMPVALNTSPFPVKNVAK